MCPVLPDAPCPVLLHAVSDQWEGVDALHEAARELDPSPPPETDNQQQVLGTVAKRAQAMPG
jgi:hypothetical protein